MKGSIPLTFLLQCSSQNAYPETAQNMSGGYVSQWRGERVSAYLPLEDCLLLTIATAYLRENGGHHGCRQGVASKMGVSRIGEFYTAMC